MLKKKRAELRRNKVSNKENETPEGGFLRAEINQNECAVCSGIYDDDIIDGVLQKEWIRCTNTDTCGLWMHCECLGKDSESSLYVCHMCKTTFA